MRLLSFELSATSEDLTRRALNVIVNLMVQYSQQLDAVFSALGHPTRRAILTRLTQGDTCVTTLAEPHDMSLTAVAKHLRVLERAGLLTQNKEGRVMWCRLNPGPFKGAAEWIAHYQRFWEKSLDALADYFDESNQGDQSE